MPGKAPGIQDGYWRARQLPQEEIPSVSLRSTKGYSGFGRSDALNEMENNINKTQYNRQNNGNFKDNLCKQSLIQGQKTCNNEDLLTECMEMCKKDQGNLYQPYKDQSKILLMYPKKTEFIDKDSFDQSHAVFT